MHCIKFRADECRRLPLQDLHCKSRARWEGKLSCWNMIVWLFLLFIFYWTESINKIISRPKLTILVSVSFTCLTIPGVRLAGTLSHQNISIMSRSNLHLGSINCKSVRHSHGYASEIWLTVERAHSMAGAQLQSFSFCRNGCKRMDAQEWVVEMGSKTRSIWAFNETANSENLFYSAPKMKSTSNFE